MSLNKTLDRLFDEIRREAKRNPEFADRLDAVLRLHNSRRDVDEEVVESVAAPEAQPASTPKRAAKAPAPAAKAEPATKPEPEPSAPAMPAEASVNPVGLYQREGEEALACALEDLGLPALQAMVAEHNLDPSGEAADLDRDALVAHVITHAKRRAERDAKMFDY
jgi:hypothetical protein